MIFIILNDLRAIPVAAALSIKKMHSNDTVKLLVSEEWLKAFDYGQKNNCGLLKIKIFFLEKLEGLIIIKTKKEIEKEIQKDITGIMSSFYSITNDSQATADRYPDVWFDLERIDHGTRTIVEYIKENIVDKIYLFNGRTASSYHIAKFAMDSSIKIEYYEYGLNRYSNLLNKKYTLTNFPIHRLHEWGKQLLVLYESDIKYIDISRKLSPKYKESKIKNQFVNSYIKIDVKEYDVVIFLSSAHEYMAINQAACGDIISVNDLVFVEKVIKRNGIGLKYAVRCHPNQLKDPSWATTLSPLKKYCEDNKIDFYGPDSIVSSHALIVKSKIVAVDISSIGIDALILGKFTQIYGMPEYKVIYNKAIKLFGDNQSAICDYVVEVLSLKNILCQEKIPFKGKIWLYFDYYSSKIIKNIFVNK